MRGSFFEVLYLMLFAVSSPIVADGAFLTSDFVAPMDVAASSSLGPLGALGPLGPAGPIGNSPWNPYRYFSALGDWAGPAAGLSSIGSPLGATGPLGEFGPLGKSFRDFPLAYHPGERLAVLGPAGPLGGLGPLGPLGPVGAHGFRVDGEGRYRDATGRIVRRVKVPWGDASREREYPLVEYLVPKAAAESLNDTSFLVSDSVGTGQAKQYRFRAETDGWVTVLVVPEALTDDLRLILFDGDGRVTAKAESSSRSLWIHGRIPEKSEWRVEVRSRSSEFPGSRPFRLVLTGLETSLRGH